MPDPVSPFEARALAVKAALDALTGALVLRDAALPEEIPPAGLVFIAEPEPVELAELVGGEREWLWEIGVELAVLEGGPTGLDALAQDAAAALKAHAPLAALVDGLRIHPLRDRQTAAVPGAASIRSATLPLELMFSTGADPLEA